MSIQVVCTPYGSPATERLGQQIDAHKNGNPLAPVTVIVPTNIAGLATRRALGTRNQGIAAVNFLKLFDLAERLAGRQTAQPGKAAEHPRLPLSDLVIGAAMRRALNADPGVFRASAHHPATEQALVRSYRDLRDVPDDEMDKLAMQSRRAADVVRLYRQVRSDLQEEWYDGQDLIDWAVDALQSESLGDGISELEPVIVHLPQRVTKAQGRMISVLAETAAVVVVAGLTGDDKADALVRESVSRMGGAIDGTPAIGQSHGQQIISTASADEEIGVAVREVVRAARDGIPLARVAVLCGGGTPTVRQALEQLEAAGIECNGPSGHTLAGTLAGRGLLALLNLKNRDFRRDEVFTLLSATAPVLPGGNEPAPVMAWERISRQAGVARGAEQWGARLAHHAQKLRDDANKEQQNPDHIEERVERLRREASLTDSLAQYMAGLVSRLSPDPPPTSWTGWCQWVEGLIDTYLVGTHPLDDWPETEKEAAKAIRKILNRLAGLDAIEHRPRSAAFLSNLVSELSAPTERIGQVGRGVLVGRIGDSLGLELDRLIVVGMAEGTFPHSPLDDPLLPDRERKAAGDDLALIADQIDDQHRSLLGALAFAQSSTLVYARGDSRRSAEQHPSRWLLDTATALAGHPVDSTNLEALVNDKNADWFEHVPSFSGRVTAGDELATDQEFRLNALARGGRGDHPMMADSPQMAGVEMMAGDPILARGAELAAARASDQFTRFDGNLARLDVAALTQDVMSPTSLEAWADCPMRYFFKHVLRVQTADHPEELLEISPLEKGSLVHEALDEFMQQQLQAGTVPPPGQLWDEEQQNLLLAIGEEKCNEAESKGLTGTPAYWHHDRGRIMADLDRFLHEDNEQRRQHGVTPIASELGFGARDAQQSAVEVALPGPRKVRFRGQADRVDQGASGLLVTDYKTGKSDSYKGLDEESRDWDPVQRGTRLQLPVYGLAARDHVDRPDEPVRAQYWFVTGTGDFKTCGYPLDEGVMSRFQETLVTITDGIGAGVFCDRPQPGQTEGPFSQRCDYCNADRLGTEDHRQKWELVQDRPELAAYRDLAEPPDDDADGEMP